MSDDPYAALGLTKSASAEDIKKAHRKLVRSSHPDLHPDDPNAEARFKAVSSAYDLLKDPETRAKFDAGEIDASGAERHDRAGAGYYRDYAGRGQGGARAGAGGGFAGFDGDPGDIFAEMLRQRAGAGGGGQSGFGGFGSGFGGGGGSFRSAGTDARYSLTVGFLDAVRGTKVPITLPDGNALEVTIPAGTQDGQTLRLRGKGGAGMGGGPNGDALVSLTLRPHPVFRRDGDDILMTLPITLDEAVLGGKVAVPTIDGRVNVTIPKGANSGQQLRLRDRGVAGKGGTRGAQKIELRIVTPAEIDPELAEFMERWRTDHAYDPRKDLFEGEG
ncbi:DnaJ C-terminal domain-containing protein [Pseudoruegeria sp. SK021]|uniref:DnaJ C-terminal domain-containing protein n=1 Tax=Pseudoruegeria sp. SK021 TaxID=1933035 RepID=UPI000A23EC3F|nr:DnaJ C-terminal domain-containing protein [Pseudoruegeria sp. SK021]OSP56128.1 molecular chaperone DnaJ [Pseudoruegeria sp. SK021]